MTNPPVFAPILAIPPGTTDIGYYPRAFGAVEQFRVPNDDGSVHVACFTINGTEFYLHEAMAWSNVSAPGSAGTTTVTVGLFVADVHGLVDRAVAAGATLISPVKDYEYGYRQGTIVDPFGHHWEIQKKLI